MRNLLMLALVLTLSACAAVQVSNVVPTYTATIPIINNPIPSSTFTVVPIHTNTPTQGPTFTPTALPDALKNSILQAYKLLIIIQVEPNLVYETANRINTGNPEELTVESFKTLQRLFLMMKDTDNMIAQIIVPELIKTQWDEAIVIHNQTKDIHNRWFNLKIDSATVLGEVNPLITSIENTLSSVDNVLLKMYGFDTVELQKVRDDAIASIYEIWNTPTPTP